MGQLTDLSGQVTASVRFMTFEGAGEVYPLFLCPGRSDGGRVGPARRPRVRPPATPEVRIELDELSPQKIKEIYDSEK